MEGSKSQAKQPPRKLEEKMNLDELLDATFLQHEFVKLRVFSMSKSCLRALEIEGYGRCRGIFSQKLVELTAQHHGQRQRYKFRHV